MLPFYNEKIKPQRDRVAYPRSNRLVRQWQSWALNPDVLALVVTPDRPIGKGPGLRLAEARGGKYQQQVGELDEAVGKWTKVTGEREHPSEVLRDIEQESRLPRYRGQGTQATSTGSLREG